MVIVIVDSEICPDSGRSSLVVSHGVDSNTGKEITMPPVTPHELGAVFDQQLGEYVLP